MSYVNSARALAEQTMRMPHNAKTEEVFQPLGTFLSKAKYVTSIKKSQAENLSPIERPSNTSRFAMLSD